MVPADDASTDEIGSRFSEVEPVTAPAIAPEETAAIVSYTSIWFSIA